MDYQELYNSLKENLFTDLSLKLVDQNNTITIRLHKIILYSSCVYFRKLLTSCRERNLNEITIQVPNTFIMHDIIMSFYGQKMNSQNLPDWQHLLETIRCWDFLGIPFESDILRNLRVPIEGFDLLLDVIDLVGYNDFTIKLIKKNLPNNYDTSIFPKELLEELFKPEYRIVSGSSDNSIKIWNAETGELIRTLLGHTNSVWSVCFSSDNKQIVSGSCDRSIKIWNAETGELIRTLLGHTATVTSVCFSSNNKQIISGGCDNSIKTWNAET